MAVLGAVATIEGLDILNSELKKEVQRFILIGSETHNNNEVDTLVSTTETLVYNDVKDYIFYKNSLESTYFDEDGVFTCNALIPTDEDLNNYVYLVGIITNDNKLVSITATPKMSLIKGIGGSFIVKIAVSGNAGEIVFKNSDFITISEAEEIFLLPTKNNALAILEMQDKIDKLKIIDNFIFCLLKLDISLKEINNNSTDTIIFTGLNDNYGNIKELILICDNPNITIAKTSDKAKFKITVKDTFNGDDIEIKVKAISDTDKESLEQVFTIKVISSTIDRVDLFNNATNSNKPKRVALYQFNDNSNDLSGNYSLNSATGTPTYINGLDGDKALNIDSASDRLISSSKTLFGNLLNNDKKWAISFYSKLELTQVPFSFCDGNGLSSIFGEGNNIKINSISNNSDDVHSFNSIPANSFIVFERTALKQIKIHIYGITTLSYDVRIIDFTSRGSHESIQMNNAIGRISTYINTNFILNQFSILTLSNSLIKSETDFLFNEYKSKNWN